MPSFSESPRRYLRLEQLEARIALAADGYDVSRLLSEQGTFNGTSVTMPLEVNTAEFSMPSGHAVFGLQVRSLSNNPRIPSVAAIQDASGRTLSPLYRRPVSNTDQSSSIVLYQLSAGTHQMLIQGGVNSTYRIEVFLAGDLDGNRQVDSAELNRLRVPPILGARSGDLNYSLAADVNRDGRISSEDYFLARGNVGIMSTIPERYSIAIDSSLVPSMPNYFNPVTGQADSNRPLARIAGPNGELVDFVANEVVLMTTQDSELTAFLQRWNGTLLHTDSLADAGLSDSRKVHTIRINTSLASSDVGQLSTALERLTPSLLGTTRVSSSQGVRLLNVAASEQILGTRIGANFLMQGNVFQDAESLESSNSMGITGYSRDVFDWPHMTAGSTQDIGVPQAWQRLEVAGRLQPAIDLAILDMGFAASADDPPGTVNISNVPFVFSILGRENLLSCGGSSCPYHGTSVFSTAVARADNGFGSAGVAAGVARPIRIFTLYDMATCITAVLAAKAAGADVINMSFSGGIPAGLDIINLPFEITTAALRAANTLLFAAAGNQGTDIDKRAKFLGVPLWETTNHTPVENAGVIGVGGLAMDDTVRHSGSNYGASDVDIYAPFTVYAGPDPSLSNSDIAQRVSGTSVSSPFAAGVAALVWAADPSQSANQVESRLLTTAHVGRSTTTPIFKVNRYVNAFDAVESVLRTQPNHAPFIEFPNSISGQSFARGAFDPVPLQVTARDFEDGSGLTVQWYSDRDGLVATGSDTRVSNLSYGVHLLSVRVTDSGGLTTSRNYASVTITNQAPTIQISAPTSGQEILVNQSFTLRAISRDLNEVEQNYTLNDNQVVWYSNRRGLLGIGHDRVVTFPDLGLTTIIVVATDSRGLQASASVTINVRSVIGNAPSVNITSPNNNQLFYTQAQDTGSGRWYADVQLRVTVTDVEDTVIANSRITWTTDRTDLQPAALGSGRIRTVRLYANPFTATHRVRVSFTDSDGNTVTDSITINLNTLI